MTSTATRQVDANKTTIVKRELVSQGFIKATDNNGITYRSVSGKAIGKGCFKDEATGKYFTPYTTELKTKEMLNVKRDMVGFSNNYRNGLAEEKRIIAFLQEKGFNVRPSSKEENYSMDIDCWIGDVAVSIKAEHKGERYGDIYFELRNQITSTGEWVADGWYYKGQAQKYLILQGNDLRLYDKETIKEYVEENGWSHTRTLSWSVKAQQGGSYRTCDTESGYLKKAQVPYECRWVLD